MATTQEMRKIRIANDYKEMRNIKGNIIQWKPVKGQPPYVEAYELTVKIRTITGPTSQHRDQHKIYLELPENYPIAPPKITMQSKPQPYHPNWYSGGDWCYGTWNLSESLGHHVIRMIRTLQFDPEITNPNSPANSEAKNWYLDNQNKDLFPCDNNQLPDPTTGKIFSINKPKMFQINSN